VSGTVLGFDYGDKRIGVAVGETFTRSARPLATLAQDWPRIIGLIEEWRPSACVVGLPLTADGETQAVTTRALQFAATLRKRSGLPVHTCDERHSSLAAETTIKLRKAEGRRRAGAPSEIDAVAACLILEQWLNQTPTPSTPA